MPAGRPATHNYEELRQEFDCFGGYLRDFANQKKINYSLLSRRFSELDAERREENIQNARKTLAFDAKKAAKKLSSLVDSEDETVAFRASNEVLNKVGITSSPAPQVSQSNTVNAVQIQFFLPQNERVKVVEANVEEAKLLEDGEE
jgi:hypothetical protein